MGQLKFFYVCWLKLCSNLKFLKWVRLICQMKCLKNFLFTEIVFSKVISQIDFFVYMHFLFSHAILLTQFFAVTGYLFPRNFQFFSNKVIKVCAPRYVVKTLLGIYVIFQIACAISLIYLKICRNRILYGRRTKKPSSKSLSQNRRYNLYFSLFIFLFC